MAVQANDLVSLYEPSLIQAGSGSVHLDEKQNKKNGLAEVNLLVNASYILLKPDFLKRSENLYRKIDSHISLRQINDGTLLIDTSDGNHYLVYVELKSGYNDVGKKAIYQIPVSSIKIKSYLRNLASYVPGEYKELGLIISYPPQASDRLDADNNDMVFEAKQDYIDNQVQPASNSVAQSLRKNGQAVIQAADFPTLLQAAFHPDIRFQAMPVFHKPVMTDGETIDLTSLLRQV